MKVIVATGNKDKAKEIREILRDMDAGVTTMKEAGFFAQPEENGSTFLENAVIKAKAVAEEAAQTAEFFGNHVERIYDVGVSGIHRLLSRVETIQSANCVVAAAGMEGALASVVGGLVDKPVIAVPTSVGYGASFGGLSALLTMINSCANGITVVNIDNGYGAGYVATQINRLAVKGHEKNQ